MTPSEFKRASQSSQRASVDVRRVETDKRRRYPSAPLREAAGLCRDCLSVQRVQLWHVGCSDAQAAQPQKGDRHDTLRVVVCHGRPVSRLRPRCAITNVTDTEGPTTGANPSVNITGALTLGLQASRLGAGNGRAYTIEIRCADVSGNATTTNEAVRLSPT